MYVFGLHICLCTVCVHGPFGGYKRALDVLELELSVVVSWEPNMGPLEEHQVSLNH